MACSVLPALFNFSFFDQEFKMTIKANFRCPSIGVFHMPIIQQIIANSISKSGGRWEANIPNQRRKSDIDSQTFKLKGKIVSTACPRHKVSIQPEFRSVFLN